MIESISSHRARTVAGWRERPTNGPRRARGWRPRAAIALLGFWSIVALSACGDRRIIFCNPTLPPEANGGCGMAGAGGAGAAGGAGGVGGAVSGPGGVGGTLALGGTGGSGGVAGVGGGTGGDPQLDASVDDDSGTDAGDQADAAVTP
jgi:hypothetical protein